MEVPLGGLRGWLRRDELHMQMEPGDTSVTNTECLVEEIGHRRLKAWVSFTQHLCGLKEGQDVEIKRYTEVMARAWAWR